MIENDVVVTPPFGFVTVKVTPTFVVPVMAGPEAVKVNVVPLASVTAPSVTNGVLDVTVVPVTKPVPVMVTLTAVAPATTEAGETVVTVGAALTTTFAADVNEPPVVLVTVTGAEVAVAVADTDKVITLGVTDVTVADKPLVLGKETVAPDRKPEPSTYTV